MRKICRQPPDTPQWQRWLKDCKKAKQALLEAVARGEKPSFKENLYRRKSIKKEYFLSREAPFYGKCAYCECYLTDFQHGDIEHFRPKGAVTDENDQLIYLKDEQDNPILNEEGKAKAHPGYYWLAYDWHNLLPSCTVCNQPSDRSDRKVGKHNRFPVAGKHAQFPGEEIHEQPLLINPASEAEEDTPEKHLTVLVNSEKDPMGFMLPLSERGKMCIQVFDLNRPQLVEERQKTGKSVYSLLVEIIYGNSEQKIQVIDKLKAIKEGRESYTMAALTALRDKEKDFKAVFEEN